MGHSIIAVVGHDKTIEQLAQRFVTGRVLEATQGIAVFPASTPALMEECAQLDSGVPKDGGPTVPWDEDAQDIPRALILEVARASKTSSLAVVQTEYFGGHGGQGAGVISNGDWTLPWTWLSTDDRPQPEIWPINRALIELGIRKAKGLDEFDTIGLGKYRHFT